MTRARDIADRTFNTDASFGDNDKAIFGADNDLEIGHTGGNSDIKETGTGNLRIWGDDIQFFNSAGSKYHAQMISDGAVSLYNNGQIKLATTSTGVDVTGEIDASGAISSTGTGAGNAAFKLQEASNNPWYLMQFTGGAFSLNYNGTTGGASKLVVDASGRVGIGTSSPSRLLSLNSSNASIDFSNGTWTNEIINSSGQMEFRADHTNAAAASLISFSVDGSEAARIDSTGDLLVNTTTTVRNASAVGVSIEAAGRIFLGRGASSGGFSHLGFVNVNGIVGTIVSSGSSTTYNTSSDYRIKENVVADWDATTRLKQLNPVRFNFIADADTTVDGFLAHEVQDIVPEAITGTKDAMRDEEYQVSAATGDIYTPAIDAVLDEDGVEVTPAVAEVIHSTDVERPEELAEGQQWRETTEAVMGTRAVPDYQGIDQSKMVPLLTKSLIEAVEKIEQLEARIAALEAN